MIAGFGGELISHAYLEQCVLPAIDYRLLAAFERRLMRWWRNTSRGLGPASSVRAIHDVAVVPLLQLLEHRPLAASSDNAAIAGWIDGSSTVVLCVPWSIAARSMWRDAIRRGTAAGSSWALISNGRSLRVIDCTRPWSRAAIEFDFATLTLSPNGVSALWLLAGAAAMSSRQGCSLRAHIKASDEHASRVCGVLSDGVLDALPKLAAALAGRRAASELALDQALTVVYRMLFLLFAEARALVPIWHDIYRDAYSIDALVRRALQSKSKGLWEAMQAISRLAHAGCVAGDLSVTAFNGRLFSPRQAPLAERARVPDDLIRDILLSLATDPTSTGRRRISYHDLGVEQFGAVYERVLEYEPSRRVPATLVRTSIQRKATGSFYTPQSLTDFLVRRTLSPLVEGKSAEEILRLRVLDPAMGSGAFLVAAGNYLAECCESALLRDGHHRESSDALRASLRRDVAERCLYGVDLNPTAVQLARLSLWLSTLAADRPLTFLDHHLAVGNSLIGAWLADLSMPPQFTKSLGALPLLEDQIGEDLGVRVMPARLSLALEPSNTLEAVRRKERTLADLVHVEGPLARWTAACDAWCAAAMWNRSPLSPALIREWIALATGAATSLPPAQLRSSLDKARAVVTAHSPFHWELAFPEVFFDANGRAAESPGFDAVIGNPPWEVMRADIGTDGQRKDSRAITAAALRFHHKSRAYRHQGTGHANLYQLFTERALQLTRRGGRVGVLLPSGIATDHGSAALRRFLLDRTTIDTWLGFDNRHRIFPIHRSMRFVVLATTNSGTTSTLRFRNGLTDPQALHQEGLAGTTLALSRARIEALNPDHLAVPEVSSATALSILTAIADRVPALGDRSGWDVRFGRELNATDDRHRFIRLGTKEGLLPIVEGKQLSPFQVDIARSTYGVAGTPTRNRIAYRDVASATNKLTLIAAMLPAGTISTHTIFCLKTSLDEESQWALLGLLNSLVANYLVRMNVTTHVTTAIMSRLRVPKPDGRDASAIAALARSLSHSGIDGGVEEYAELNAIAARLYGVTRDEYAAILDSFPLIYTSVRERCLSAHSSYQL